MCGCMRLDCGYAILFSSNFCVICVGQLAWVLVAFWILFVCSSSVRESVRQRPHPSSWWCLRTGLLPRRLFSSMLCSLLQARRGEQFVIAVVQLTRHVVCSQEFLLCFQILFFAAGIPPVALPSNLGSALAQLPVHLDAVHTAGKIRQGQGHHRLVSHRLVLHLS